jgi:hypothetical protein
MLLMEDMLFQKCIRYYILEWLKWSNTEIAHAKLCIVSSFSVNGQFDPSFVVVHVGL